MKLSVVAHYSGMATLATRRLSLRGASPGSFVEAGRLGPHPVDELADIVIGEQRLDGRIFFRELTFAKKRVQLPVADPMQHRDVLAALRLGHEVMFVALACRNRPAA